MRSADKADIITVVGTRPQFVKASEVSRALAQAGLREILVHTGQHHDDNMSRDFFTALDLREPDINLAIGSGPHGRQTGRMLEAIEGVLTQTPHDRVLVYGDCNSTLAAALAAAKLATPIDHVEAGLRSFKRHMPEEINRTLTDRLSDTLFCPTQKAVEHLQNEGLTQGVHLVGDVMIDAVVRQLPRALDTPLGRSLNGEDADESAARAALGLAEHDPLPKSGQFRLATVHRAANTDDPATLQRLLDTLAQNDMPTYLAMHPRTRNRIQEGGLTLPPRGLVTLPPLGYLAMLAMLRHAHQLLTDSGGLQKEALAVGTPCITLRGETEWVETVEAGWNTIAGTDTDTIINAMGAPRPEGNPPALYGEGRAAQHIAGHIVRALEQQRGNPHGF